MKLSIIIPVLNEIAQAPELSAHLKIFQQRGCEVLLVDGGSRDDTLQRLRTAGFHCITSARGRARQMNLGAVHSHGEVLLFLHADTRLPNDADVLIQSALARGANWGRFDVRIKGRSHWLPLVAWLMNWRSRVTGIATGDQAIFVRRSEFEVVGGFADQPLMEDIELSRRLRARSWPACLSHRVITSGRRWDQRGVWRTIFLMWRLRWQYWRGVSAEHLAEYYR